MSEGTPLTDDKGGTGPHEANGPQSVVPREPALSLPENDRRGQPTVEDLAARVRRLEEQYATIQDTKQLEERVAQRVSTRLRRKAVTNMRLPDPVPPPSDAPPSSEPPAPEETSVPDSAPSLVPALALPETSAPFARPVPVD